MAEINLEISEANTNINLLMLECGEFGGSHISMVTRQLQQISSIII
jgi:hypothetical protein